MTKEALINMPWWVWLMLTIVVIVSAICATIAMCIFNEITHQYEDDRRKLNELYEKYKIKEETQMNFGEALELLKQGKHVARNGWNGKGLWLELQRPDTYSKMTLPYVYLNYPSDAKTTPLARVPWLASQTDMLAEDWHEVQL